MEKRGRKSILFGKMKVIFLMLVIFSFLEGESTTNSINIFDLANPNEYKKGFEIGENSVSIGKGSIATGVNSIVLGTESIATGGNETIEAINTKINENIEKMNEIYEEEEKSKILKEELIDIRNRHTEVLNAAIRVEEIRKAKKNAKIIWETLDSEFKNYKRESDQFLEEHRNKIRDLNSKLSGISNFNITTINSEEGLENAAIKFKEFVENGTTLNLSNDFYKEYIVNYYKAIGDLRENKNKSSKYSNMINYNRRFPLYGSDFYREVYSSKYDDYDDFKDYNHTKISRFISEFEGSNNLNLGLDENGFFYSYLEINNRNYKEFNYVKKEGVIFELPNILSADSITINESNYTKLINELNIAKDQYDKIVRDIKFPKYGLSDDRVEGIRKSFKYKIWKKLNEYEKNLKLSYYQYKYEETGELSWLDKKVNIDNELVNDITEEEYRAYTDDLKHSYYSEWNFFEYLVIKGEKLNEEWYKENITDVLNRNKITTEKLTSELENILGINKNAILEREEELKRKKGEVDTAYYNYSAINPLKSDLILADEYEEVLRKLNEKSEDLRISLERLDYLKNNLTLYDLRIGKNAIAIGSSTIVSGESSIGIGNRNMVLKSKSIAIGNENNVFGENNIVIGNSNSIRGNDSFVFGNNIIINENIRNAIVLGNNSEAVSNALSIGGENNLRKIVNVEEGEISDTSNEVITGKQLKKVIDIISSDVTNFSNGKISLFNGSFTNDNNMDFVDRKYVDEMNERTKEIALKGVQGVSNAIAMSQLSQNSSFNEFNHTFSIGVGNYNGVNAVALGFSGSSENRRFTYKVGGSVNNKRNLAFGIGFGVNIGEKVSYDNENQFPRKLNEIINKLEKENEELRKKLEKLENEMKKMIK